MKTTKRALFSSVIALILCFSMLVGTTFAWFTDEVKSDVNKIVAGNLDVDVVTTADDKSIENQSVLFDEIKLWEPGVVAYENITVKNLGTLALKYQLSVNFDKENYVVEADGTVTDNCLADVLMVSVIEETIDAALSREEVLTKAGEGVLLSELVKSGELESLKNQNYAIIIWWPQSTNDDTFNINNGKTTTDGEALHINLGLKVLATQLDADIEQDSFGPDYDVDAIYTDAVVTNEAEFLEALANAKDYAIIGIKGNVTWTTGAGIGSTPFIDNATTYSLKPAVKHITLLGLTEDATFTAIGAGVGEIGIDGGTVTFKNLKIVDESVSYAENSWEYGYLEFRGNTVFENCDVVNAIMMEGDSATFVNCSFNSHDDNQYAVWVSEGDATFENCYITGARGIKVHEAYGSKVGTVVIKNNQFIDLTNKPGLAIGDVDEKTTVVLQNNTFAGTQAGDQGNYMYETDTDVTTFTFIYDKSNTVAGYAKTNTELSAKLQAGETTFVLGEGTYVLPNASQGKTLTIIGSGNTTIATNTSGSYEGCNYALDGSTVVFENIIITTDGATYTGYARCNATYNNCVINNTYTLYGDSTFNNCTFNVSGDKYNVWTWGAPTATFNNCTINSDGKALLLYGQANTKLTLNGCTFNDNGGLSDKKAAVEIGNDYNKSYTLTANNTVVNGYEINDKGIFTGSTLWGNKNSMGTDKLTVTINGTQVYGPANTNTLYIDSAAGLFAFAEQVNEKGNTYAGKTVVLVADIDLKNQLWTPIGQTCATQFNGTFDGNGYTIKNLNVDASKQTGANYSSGLFGWLNKATVKNLTIENATVKGNHNVGVIAGYMETSGCTISNCHVINATVVAKHANDDACGDKVGVIVGHAGNAGVKVEKCSATDCTVIAGRDAGQIVGAALTANVVDCTATNVTVTAGGDCAHSANVNNAIIGRVLG